MFARMNVYIACMYVYIDMLSPSWQQRLNCYIHAKYGSEHFWTSDIYSNTEDNIIFKMLLWQVFFFPNWKCYKATQKGNILYSFRRSDFYFCFNSNLFLGCVFKYHALMS